MNSPETEGDEKEAILSLLQFSELIPRSDSDGECADASTQQKIKKERTEPEGNAFRNLAHSVQEDVPRNISPPPPQRPEQVFIKDMVKKRKDHPTAEGQFEDAPDIFIPPVPTEIAAPSGLQSQQQQASAEAAAFAAMNHRMMFEGGINGASNMNFPPQRAAAAAHGFVFPPHRQEPPQAAAHAIMDPTLCEQQERERRFHLEAMLRAHMALQLLPPAPNGFYPGAAGVATAANQIQQQRTHQLSQTQPQNRLSPVTASATLAGKAQQVVSSSQGQNDEEGGYSVYRSRDAQDYAMRKCIEAPAMQPPPMRTSENETEEERGRRFLSTRIRYEEYTPPVSWAELTNVPKMPHTPADDDMNNPLENINENDVLLGRGGLTNTNPGNMKFRALVSKHRMAYCTAPKGDKGALARFLCNYIRAKHGRFLRREESDPKWYEVGDEKAVMKCGQALREGTAELIRKAVHDGPPRGVHQIDPDVESYLDPENKRQRLA